MTDQLPPSAENPAAAAFEKLRSEIEVLRLAIGTLSRQGEEAPDYGPTLDALVATNEETTKWLSKVSQLPALRSTAQDVGGQVSTAVARLREGDRQALTASQSQLAQAVADIRLITRRAREREEQDRMLKIVGACSFLGGWLTLIILIRIMFATG